MSVSSGLIFQRHSLPLSSENNIINVKFNVLFPVLPYLKPMTIKGLTFK
jgi:hypothetical protein